MSLLDTTSGVPGQNKPAILCLHGSGTNSTIFNVQSIRIQRALASHFSFVFIDGPFETAAGPGVVPFFEGCGPFLRWITFTGQIEMPDESKKILLKAEEQQMRKDGRGFVGVMGFSQGGRAAAGLLLEQQLKKGASEHEGLRFAVLLNSIAPPMAYGLTKQELFEPINIPSLHVVGVEDPWRDSGRQLFLEHFNQEKSVMLEFNVGHRLPILEEDTMKIVTEILKMHKETSTLKTGTM